MADPLLSIVIEGDPIPKARPVVTRNGTYTPKRTKTAEAAIRYLIKNEWAGQKPVEGPLEIILRFDMRMPKGWSKIKTANMLGSPCTKIPDLDNLEKCVCDGINKSGFWLDDSQVCKIQAEKRWAVKGKTFLEIRELK